MKEEELKNHEKIHKNLYQEQEKLQRRLDMISDPKYPAELKRRHQDLDSQLKALSKEQKLLNADQARREKRLDKLINVGESDLQRDCTNAQNTLNTMLDRESKAQQSLIQAQETQKQVLQKQQEVGQKLRELELKAKQMGITDLDQISTVSGQTSKNGGGGANALTVREKLMRDKRIHEQNIVSLRKKVNIELQAKKKDIEKFK